MRIVEAFAEHRGIIHNPGAMEHTINAAKLRLNLIKRRSEHGFIGDICAEHEDFSTCFLNLPDRVNGARNGRRGRGFQDSVPFVPRRKRGTTDQGKLCLCCTA